MQEFSIDAFIEQFIAELVAEKFAEDVFNQYAAGENPNNAIRRENLRRYLLEMAEHQPKIMLLMEAPGYRGCRLTGLPVTSRKILSTGVPELSILREGYQAPNDAGFEDIQGEQTATIVWGTLANLRILPLIWSSFPFHPRQAGIPRSNRAPRSSEKAIGRRYLKMLLSAFTIEKYIAVGNVAEEALKELNLPYAKVRHPAQGGKNDFVTGLSTLLGNQEKS